MAALQASRSLHGRPIGELVEPVPRGDLVRAMTDELPSLLDDLEDDTRNVVLTLARIWMTVETGEIRAKEIAADWALSNDYRRSGVPSSPGPVPSTWAMNSSAGRTCSRSSAPTRRSSWSN